MRTLMKSFALWSLLAGVALSAGAAEMKKAAIIYFGQNIIWGDMADKAIATLATSGFEDGKNIAITKITTGTPEERKQQIESLQPDVILEMTPREQVALLLKGTAWPVISLMEAEKYVSADLMPTANITGVTSTLPDMIYNSYKFLNKVAPLQSGQQAVFLENPKYNLIPREAVQDALQRLRIPLKAIVDTSIMEDWYAAIEQYNQDPEVGWILIGTWPFTKRDGSAPDRETEIVKWQREHLKKPSVTYWETPVQSAFLCGFGADMVEMGVQGGEMAARVLNGEDIKTINAEYPRKTFVSLNRKTADTLGITFSLDVLNLANVIYHDWEGKEVSRKSGLK